MPRHDSYVTLVLTMVAPSLTLHSMPFSGRLEPQGMLHASHMSRHATPRHAIMHTRLCPPVRYMSCRHTHAVTLPRRRYTLQRVTLLLLIRRTCRRHTRAALIFLRYCALICCHADIDIFRAYAHAAMPSHHAAAMLPPLSPAP